MLLVGDEPVDLLWQELPAQLQGVVALTTFINKLVLIDFVVVEIGIRQLMRIASVRVGVGDKRRQPLIELLRIVSELLFAG